MDMLGAKTSSRSKSCGNNKNKNCRKKEMLKVVYISSPMKVKTSASRFRSLVQELTGRDSDISRFDDINNSTTNFACYDDDDTIFPTTPDFTSTGSQVVPRRVVGSEDQAHMSRAQSMVESSIHQESPTSSESFLDDVFSSEMIEELEGMIPSNSFHESFSSGLNFRYSSMFP